MSREIGCRLKEPVCFWMFDYCICSKNKKVFLSQYDGKPGDSAFEYFVDNVSKYDAFCDDFGPMNLESIVRFIENFDSQTAKIESGTIVFCAKQGCRGLTNAAFLLGAYMLLKLGMGPADIAQRLDSVGPNRFESYRDATFAPPDFGLHLIDCWKGIQCAVARRWLALPSMNSPEMWGMIDIKEYVHYDDPLNGDLHEVVPGKFVAFKGPEDVPAHREYLDDDARDIRIFGPEYYTGIFRFLGVTTVVRLNEARYDARAFAAAGIDHHHLFFDDCTVPPPNVVTRFLAIADAAPGLVAVHCHAGLGRTGTLIALYMMKRHGFAAREAIGWLRVMRPGSVIGAQQHYLVEVEQQMRWRRAPSSSDRSAQGPAQQRGAPAAPPLSSSAPRLTAAPAAPPAPPPPPAPSPPPAPARPPPSVLAAQVAAGLARRSSARSLAGPSGAT